MGHYINVDRLEELMSIAFPWDEKQPYGGLSVDALRMRAIVDELKTTPRWNEDFLLRGIADRLSRHIPRVKWRYTLEKWSERIEEARNENSIYD